MVSNIKLMNIERKNLHNSYLKIHTYIRNLIKNLGWRISHLKCLNNQILLQSTEEQHFMNKSKGIKIKQTCKV